MTVQPLFEPFCCKRLVLQNGFVTSPTTRSGSQEGLPDQDVASGYRRGADYEAGLMLSEGAAIDPLAAAHDPHVPHFYGEAALNAWQQIHDSVVRAGGVMAPQLWHMGHDPSPKQRGGVAMDERAIMATIDAYAQAAKQAHKLGFAAVEIHAAHGFLIDQFFWHVTNDRTDRFGGKTLAERSRLGCEVISAMRRAVGDDLTLIMRLSQSKPSDPKARTAATCAEMEQWLTPLVEAGVDILHCAQSHWYRPEFAGSPLNFAGWAKKITDLPVITSGRVGLASQPQEELEELVRRKERGEFDLVALDEVLNADPLWVSHLKHGTLGPQASRAPGSVHRVI
jgi:2,4-dienoyl-CoA reductase-like NADH-dependent reductase (Old Yellow Enzyme family)